MTLSAPFVAAAQIEITNEISGPSWALIPVTRVDVGNDGSEEFSEQLVGGGTAIPVTFGPVPLVVRCTLGAQLSGSGNLLGTLRLRIVPRDTFVAQWVSGCGGIDLQTAPRFDGGLESVYVPSLVEPGVLVFGLASQPLSLGSIGGFPCFLLPRPDVVVLAAPFTSQVLPIPAAVRPLNVFVQAVAFSYGSLAVSPGKVVFAQ